MHRKTISILALASGAVLMAAFAAAGGTKDDMNAGRSAFEKRCTGCHALDHGKSGPRLAGVVGRKAGTVPEFPYSKVLSNSSVVWNETTLNKWMTDPETVIPDNDMAFRLNDPTERAAIIAFLKATVK